MQKSDKITFIYLNKWICEIWLRGNVLPVLKVYFPKYGTIPLNVKKFSSIETVVVITLHMSKNLKNLNFPFFVVIDILGYSSKV